jgi:hypothetical protein
MELISMRGKVILIRWAVWGQSVGILVMALVLAIEDMPDILKRASLWNFILPIIAVIIIQMRKPSNYLARNLPTGILTLIVLIISLSNTAIALANTIHAFKIPDYLVTPSWQYTRTTSIIILLIFSIALIINIVLIIRALRGDDKPQTDA